MNKAFDSLPVLHNNFIFEFDASKQIATLFCHALDFISKVQVPMKCDCDSDFKKLISYDKLKLAISLSSKGSRIINIKLIKEV
jgi:hypothetical protein